MRQRHTDAYLATRIDRVLDRRTSSEIVSNMERIANDPDEIAKRDAFYADLRERTAAENAARFERLEANNAPNA